MPDGPFRQYDPTAKYLVQDLTAQDISKESARPPLTKMGKVAVTANIITSACSAEMARRAVAADEPLQAAYRLMLVGIFAALGVLQYNNPRHRPERPVQHNSTS